MIVPFARPLYPRTVTPAEPEHVPPPLPRQNKILSSGEAFDVLKRPIHVPIPMCAFASLVAVDVAVSTSEPGMNENGAVVVTVTRTALAVEGSSGAAVQLLSRVGLASYRAPRYA